MGESVTLDPADHVSVTLLYSRAGRGLSSVISMPRLPEPEEKAALLLRDIRKEMEWQVGHQPVF